MNAVTPPVPRPQRERRCAMNHCREDYRDDLCACGAKLPNEVRPGSWQDHGFCSLRCAAESSDSFRLYGQAAIEMATCPGRQGGPGFEFDLVRDWLRAATPSARPSLLRASADADAVGGSRDSWAWRLSAGGQCWFFRLTAKSNCIRTN